MEDEGVRRSIFAIWPEAAGNAAPGTVPPIDRAKLGTIVFADATARQKLNGIMKWPIIKQTMKKIWNAYWQGLPAIVVDAPLLFEAKMDKICSVTITVYIEREEDQIERLMERDRKNIAAQAQPGSQTTSSPSSNTTADAMPSNPPPKAPSPKPMTREEAENRVHAQMALSEKCRRATYQLDNSGTLDQLQNNIDVLIAQIKRTHRPWLPRNSLLVYTTTLFFVVLIYVVFRLTSVPHPSVAASS